MRWYLIIHVFSFTFTRLSHHLKLFGFPGTFQCSDPSIFGLNALNCIKPERQIVHQVGISGTNKWMFKTHNHCGNTAAKDRETANCHWGLL